jgi:hypothetical protein
VLVAGRAATPQVALKRRGRWTTSPSRRQARSSTASAARATARRWPSYEAARMSVAVAAAISTSVTVTVLVSLY